MIVGIIVIFFIVIFCKGFSLFIRLVSNLVLHRKPCICDNFLCVTHLPNRKIAQMRRAFFEELVSNLKEVQVSAPDKN